MATKINDLVRWLARVENLALECYQRAQTIPGFSPGMAEFLRDCAEEEAWHLNALNKAAGLLEGKAADLPSDLEIDARTLERIEAPFRKILDRDDLGPADEKKVLECIAVAEFSEWNYIFVYIMDRISEFNGDLLFPAARIQSHLRKIIDYFELTGFDHQLLRRLKTLPRVWEESILVVDDNAAIRELLAGILQTQGRVDLARDGLEALDLLKNRYYKVIISDLEMPRMNGLEFFRKALEIYPRIAGRIIFLSANTHLLDSGPSGIEKAAVLRKPFRAWELTDRVKVLLAGG